MLPSAKTGSGGSVAVSARSASGPRYDVVTVVLSLALLGSATALPAEKDAWSVRSLCPRSAESARITIVKIEFVPFRRLGCVQLKFVVAFTAGAVQLQPAGTTMDWNRSVLELTTFNTAFVPSSGPPLLTVTV